MKIGYEEEVVMFPFHKRKVKTISMKPPIFGEFYMKVHLLQVKDVPNLLVDHFTVVCSVTWPLMEARLQMTLFWYRTRCFYCVNHVVLTLTIFFFSYEKQRGFYKSNVTSSLTCIHWPGNWTHNCKMAYLRSFLSKINRYWLDLIRWKLCFIFFDSHFYSRNFKLSDWSGMWSPD